VIDTRWPQSWLRRFGRVAAAAWVIGLLGILAPPLLVAPLLVLALRVVLRPMDRGAWKALAISVPATLLAMPLLLPWVALVDIEAYLSAGSEYWTPAIIPAGAAGVAFLAGIVSAESRRLDAVILGGVLAGLGAIGARGVDLGLGREVAVSSLAVVALGTAFLVGGAIDSMRDADIRGVNRVTAGLGAVSAAILVATSVFPLYGGRAGLPSDELTDPLRFTAVAEGEADASRILLVGPASTLPGESRTVRGADYRVVSAPVPALWETRLPAASAVDDSLEQELLALIEGQEARAGETLAAFGIRWVVVTGSTPLQAVFEGQLDLVALGGAKRPTFLVDAEAPYRARVPEGEPWSREGTGYGGVAEPGETVFLAETANSRWGPTPWIQSGWGNEVSAGSGSAVFDPIESRRNQAYASGGLFVFLLLLSAIARRRR
jgi:hypothetical protein